MWESTESETSGFLIEGAVELHIYIKKSPYYEQKSNRDSFFVFIILILLADEDK